MRLRTKGYLAIITIVIFLEIIMIRLYITAANEFEPYQLSDVFNNVKDNEYEGGIVLLFGAIIMQIFLAGYLIYQDRRTIEH